MSAGVFTSALAVCLLDLWLETGQGGQLYVLGVTARRHGHHGIGVNPAVLVWCLAVPMGLTILAAVWRRRTLGRRPRLHPN